jgi:hypothetical protein
MKYVNPEPMTGCWLWSGGYAGNGYPMFSYQSKAYKASRFSYETFKGDLQKTEVVRHQCHNPACVNPDHLLKGTQTENMQDAILSNRLTFRKLSTEEAQNILDEYIPFEVSLNMLAKKYNVSKRTILDIVKDRKYKEAKRD